MHEDLLHDSRHEPLIIVPVNPAVSEHHVAGRDDVAEMQQAFSENLPALR
jgi:hypothetical protein